MNETPWHKLDDRLHAVETQTSLILSTLRNELGTSESSGNLTRLLGEFRSELRELKEHLLGTLDHPGVVLRLDRLEVTEQRRTKLISAGLLALVSLVMKAGWDLITG